MTKINRSASRQSTMSCNGRRSPCRRVARARRGAARAARVSRGRAGALDRDPRVLGAAGARAGVQDQEAGPSPVSRFQPLGRTASLLRRGTASQPPLRARSVPRRGRGAPRAGRAELRWRWRGDRLRRADAHDLPTARSGASASPPARWVRRKSTRSRRRWPPLIATAATAPADGACGSAAVHARVVEGLVAAIDAWQSGLASPGPEWPPLRAWLRDEVARLDRHWRERLDAGAVRECHGDLHLANVLQQGDESIAFDALEFAAELRWIDPLDDLAFLVMDLLANGRRDLGFRLLNAYLEHSGDYDGVPALRFFLVSRALVRAQVCALRNAGGDEPVGNAALGYLRLASALAHGRDPRLAITCGLPGSGKTFVSQSLAETVGAVRVRSDVERKRLFGIVAAPVLARPGRRRHLRRRRHRADLRAPPRRRPDGAPGRLADPRRRRLPSSCRADSLRRDGSVMRGAVRDPALPRREHALATADRRAARARRRRLGGRPRGPRAADRGRRAAGRWRDRGDDRLRWPRAARTCGSGATLGGEAMTRESGLSAIGGPRAARARRSESAAGAAAFDPVLRAAVRFRPADGAAAVRVHAPLCLSRQHARCRGPEHFDRRRGRHIGLPGAARATRPGSAARPGESAQHGHPRRHACADLEPGAGRGRSADRSGRRPPRLRCASDRSAGAERRRVAPDRGIDSGREEPARVERIGAHAAGRDPRRAGGRGRGGQRHRRAHDAGPHRSGARFDRGASEPPARGADAAGSQGGFRRRSHFPGGRQPVRLARRVLDRAGCSSA